VVSLQARYRIILIVDERDTVFLRKYLEKLGHEDILVEGVRIEERSFEHNFLIIRKNVFVSPRRATTKNILNEMNNSTIGRWSGIISMLNMIFGTFDFSRGIWRRFEGLFIDGHEFDQLFRSCRPVKVITADYGTRPFEIRLLRSARRHGIPTIAIVPSWDNLTSKGVMGIKPDRLTVWNEIMKEEATSLHAIPERNISITGPLQFDNFFNPTYKATWSEFSSRFRVKESQPVIVYGTISPRYFKYNFDILEILREAIASGRIKGNPKIIIRIHPQVVSDPVFGDSMEAYRKLAESSDLFELSLPQTEDWSTMQVPMETDYRELISILSYADVTIASASTLIFDSFACQTPFIGVGFDGFEKGLPKNKSVRRMFEFEHYQHVYRLNGFRIAESIEQLVSFVNEYIEHPEVHSQERQTILSQQVRFTDGKNHERVITAIDRS
jgi:hypothetical protein